MSFNTNVIYLQDCIEGMRSLPNQSIDLVIADPPYNLSKGSTLRLDRENLMHGMGGEWSKAMEKWDNMPLTDYWLFSLAWITEVQRVLKPTGSFWTYGTYHNIGVINVIFQILGIEIINEIIWYKRNSFPNLSGRRFTASHETILWSHVGKKRSYYFNYELSKNITLESDLLKIKGKQMRTVWDIPNNKERIELAFGKHPTQKPIRLCERIIHTTTKPDDIILVPFCGAGSECVAAQALGRKYIGYEIDDTYIQIAQKRINHINSVPRLI